jgi:hypothetical protein
MLPLDALLVRHLEGQVNVATAPEKTRRHDPDDRARMSIETKYTAENRGVASIMSLPIAIAQQCHFAMTRPDIVLNGGPSENGLNTEDI